MKERRKEGKKERRKEGKKERRKEGRKERGMYLYYLRCRSIDVGNGNYTLCTNNSHTVLSEIRVGYCTVLDSVVVIIIIWFFWIGLSRCLSLSVSVCTCLPCRYLGKVKQSKAKQGCGVRVCGLGRLVG